MQDIPPLLPDSYVSAYVTYWNPMEGPRFVSSGTAWFNYRLQCYRIDGLFNPWDVERTQQHLWMTEHAHYGAGISYRMSLLYQRVAMATATGSHSLSAQVLLRTQVAMHEAILPQAYLRETGAVKSGTTLTLGVPADVWSLPPNNRLGIRVLHLRQGRREPLRMEQERHGGLLIRDFPNCVSTEVGAEVFDPEIHALACTA